MHSKLQRSVRHDVWASVATVACLSFVLVLILLYVKALH